MCAKFAFLPKSRTFHSDTRAMNNQDQIQAHLFKKCTTIPNVTTLGNGDVLSPYFCIAQLIQNQTSIFCVLKNVVIFSKQSKMSSTPST